MTRRAVFVGETYALTLPYSEVCMHMRVAGRTMEVLVTDDGARIQWPNGGYSPVTHGEAGIYTDSYAPLALSVQSEFHESVRKCSTLHCDHAASRAIAYTMHGRQLRDDVCKPCADSYLARPALGATEVPIERATP